MGAEWEADGLGAQGGDGQSVAVQMVARPTTDSDMRSDDRLALGPSVDGAASDDGTQDTIEVLSSRQEVWKLFELGYPVVAGYLLQMSLGIVNLLFVGHLGGGAKVFAAASLGTMLANVTGFSLGIGMATAMDTLCSQAYGAKQYKMLGIVLQRGIIILGLVCLPVIVMWLSAEKLLLAAKQDPEIAAHASKYVLGFIPGLWPSFIYEAEKKYLEGQNKTVPQMVVTGVTAVLNPLYAYLFVFVFGWGYLGASMAMSASNVTLAIGGAIACWMCLSKEEELKTWGGWSYEALRGWWPFLKLAVPGMIMVCVEWWSFEFMAIGAGWLGTVQLATQGIMMNTVALTYMLPLGVGIAASIRVGNLLGAGNGAGARKAAWVAVSVAVTMELVQVSLLAWQRHNWGRLWTDDNEATAMVATVILVACGFLVPDGVNGVVSGVLRGAGKQHVGAVNNTVAYLLFGIPAALLFAFPASMGIHGLWLGLAVATTCSSIFLCCFLYRLDWQAQVALAQQRLADSATTYAAFKASNGDDDDDDDDDDDQDGDRPPPREDDVLRSSGSDSDDGDGLLP